MTSTLDGNLYDYPRYYDLVFGSDWKAEFDFLQACFAKHAGRPVRRLFEPACGTGRLMFRLARAGYEVTGLDLNERAVAYCNDRLARHQLEPTAFVADMSAFQLSPKADAAFNMINSFRHLQTEKQAFDHLQCVAGALRKGGLYVLGIHLTPTATAPLDEESWSARRGHLVVNTHLRTTARDLRNREERFQMTYDVYTPKNHYHLENEIVFRTYTAPQMDGLLKRVHALSVEAVYDFSYEITRPVSVDARTEDAVYVLRKR